MCLEEAPIAREQGEMGYGRCSGTEKRRGDVLGLKGQLGYLPKAPLQPTGNQRASTARGSGGCPGRVAGGLGPQARAILWCEGAHEQPTAAKHCRMWADGTRQASGPQTRGGLPHSKPHPPPCYRASACERPSSSHVDTTKLKQDQGHERNNLDHWSATGLGPLWESPGATPHRGFVHSQQSITFSGNWASTSFLSRRSRKGRSTLWRRRMMRIVSSSFRSTWHPRETSKQDYLQRKEGGCRER